MGRRKGKERKDKQLLIRVSGEEFEMVRTFSKEQNIKMSEFIRRMLKNSLNRKNKPDILMIAAQKYENVLEKFRRLYSEYRKY